MVNVVQVRATPIEDNGEGPLSLLDDKLTSPDKLYYPQNIKDVDMYMTFSAYKEHAFQGATQGMQRNNMDLAGSVILPMPSNLSTGYNQNYKEEAVGAAGMAIGSALGGTEGIEQLAASAKNVAGSDDKLGAAGSAFSALSKRVKDNLGADGGLGAALNVATGEVGAGVAAAAFGPVAAGALTKGVQVGMAMSGVARNPHMAVLYETPGFRTFEFGYELRPKNYQESLAIGNIITFFKYYSHPEYDLDGHFFKYPNQFKLRFKYPEFLFRIGDCVCKSVTVDYHGEGTPLYYDASNVSGGRNLKAPAVVKLQLSFQEVKIITKKEILEKGR